MEALVSGRSAEQVLHAIEQGLVLVLPDVGQGQCAAELLEQPALLDGEGLRHHHPDEDVQVSATPSSERGDSLPANAQDGARLGPFRDRQLGPAAAERRHLDHRSERGLGEADRKLAQKARALALEEWVLGDPQDDEEVARGPAPRPRLAFARDAELAARVHPGRDLDPQRPLDRTLALAITAPALLGDDAPGAAAVAAGAGDAEEALLEGDLSRAPARGAGRGLGARGGAAAPAGRARLGPRDLDLRLGPERGLLERKVEVVAQVGAAPRPPPPGEDISEAEEVAQDVAEVGEDRWIETGARAEPGVSVGVVALALLGVAEDAVGLRRLLEALLRLAVPGFAVGMELEGELAVGGPHLLLRRVAGNAEDFVIVALGCHALRSGTAFGGGRRGAPPHGRSMAWPMIWAAFSMSPSPALSSSTFPPFRAFFARSIAARIRCCSSALSLPSRAWTDRMVLATSPSS